MPTTEQDVRHGEPDAGPVPWEQADAAPPFWFSTVRPDGRPHVTPLVPA